MIEALLSSDKYATIKNAVYSFLSETAKDFGTNKNAFCTYLIYLALATNHRKVIKNIAPNIQLLLTNPHLFLASYGCSRKRG